MPLWYGHFEGRSPRIRFQVAGTKGHPAELTAVVDTGFAGFLLIPQAMAEPHGLSPLGTTMASLANGTRQPFPTALANVGYANCTKMGVALVLPGECHALVGIDFLRIFNLGLAMTHEALCLAPVAELGRFVDELRHGPQEGVAGRSRPKVSAVQTSTGSTRSSA